MFNGYYFTYNEKSSIEFGLKIASFDSKDINEETIFSPNIVAQKLNNRNRFYIAGIDFDTPIEREITVLSEEPINEFYKRDIVNWLCSGNKFSKLTIDDDVEMEDFYYLCKITKVIEITINGSCVGYRLNIIFDSPYKYGKEIKFQVNATSNEIKNIAIKNNSNIMNDYIYPKIKIKLDKKGSIQITNLTDDENRIFELNNMNGGTEIIIDNDLKIINGKGITLENFNKNWLRLVNGNNEFNIEIIKSNDNDEEINADIEIIYQQIVMMYS